MMNPSELLLTSSVLILAVLLSGRKWLDHPERGEELG